VNQTLVLLGALCFFLSALEYLIPKPLPFMRIGLANLPLMIALDLLPLRYFAVLTLIKIAGQGIIGGALFSYVFLFSLAGSISSALLMYALRHVSGRHLSFAGIGVAGAMCSNGAQLLLARFLVFGEGMRYLIPPFLGAGLVTGFALGLFCEAFRSRSRWFALQTGAGPDAGFTHTADSSAGEAAGRRPPGSGGRRKADKAARLRQKQRERWDGLFNSGELIIAALIAVLLFLFNPSTAGRGLQFLFFWFCAWASGKKTRPFVTLTVIAGIVLVNLLAPYGRVLAAIGPLHITAGSLAAGLRKAITLEGLFMLSGAVVRTGFAGLGVKHTPDAKGVSHPLAIFIQLLGESLSVFGLISGRGARGVSRARVRPGHLIDDVDALLLELGPELTAAAAPVTETPRPGATTKHRAGRGLLILGLGVVAALTLLPGLLGLG
jgi:heptaprenyl diphosphate synthase